MEEKFLEKDLLFGLRIEETDGGVLVKARCPSCLNFVQLNLSNAEVQAGDEKSATCRSGEHEETFQLNARVVLTESGDIEGDTEVWGKVFC